MVTHGPLGTERVWARWIGGPDHGELLEIPRHARVVSTLVLRNGDGPTIEFETVHHSVETYMHRLPEDWSIVPSHFEWVEDPWRSAPPFCREYVVVWNGDE